MSVTADAYAKHQEQTAAATNSRLQSARFETTLLAGRDYIYMRCYATKSDGTKGVTKTEFIKRVAEESTESVEHTEMMVNAVLKVLVRSVADGEKITLPGFGTFDARARAARKGRNPQTGATIDIPATTYPWFSASVKFKRIVKGEDPSP